MISTDDKKIRLAIASSTKLYIMTNSW